MNCWIRHGLSLIEAVITLVVIAVVVELGMMFVQNSRESSRGNQCEDNIQRLGRAALLHHEMNCHYPTGGWGSMWLGDPDRGVGKDQPRSWEFCILSYVEGSDIPAVTKGINGEAKAEAIANLCSTPIATFTCPTRRQSAALPVKVKLKTNDTYHIPIRIAGRSDYAINTGDYAGGEPIQAELSMIPATIEQAQDSAFQWYDTSKFTGISFGRSEIKSSELKKGTSKVYMIAEKAVSPDNYSTGSDKGDNSSMYCGFSRNNGRAAAGAPQQDKVKTHDSVFGSAHPDYWFAVFCDGSVHKMSYEINRSLHKQLANRLDSTDLTGKDF